MQTSGRFYGARYNRKRGSLDGHGIERQVLLQTRNLESMLPKGRGHLMKV